MSSIKRSVLLVLVAAVVPGPSWSAVEIGEIPGESGRFESALPAAGAPGVQVLGGPSLSLSMPLLSAPALAAPIPAASVPLPGLAAAAPVPAAAAPAAVPAAEEASGIGQAKNRSVEEKLAQAAQADKKKTPLSAKVAALGKQGLGLGAKSVAGLKANLDRFFTGDKSAGATKVPAASVAAQDNPSQVGKIRRTLKKSSAAGGGQAAWLNNLEKLDISQFLVTPGNHQAWIDAISDPATKKIKMSMYHLTDQAVVQALLNKQKAGGVDIQIILDRGNLSNAGTLAIAVSLQKAGINVVASPSVFSITHTKYMLINDSQAFITSINLTNMAATTRDYGIVVQNANIAKEMLSVFAMDQKNGDSNLTQVAAAESKKAATPAPTSQPNVNLAPYTPPLSQSNLVWSPTDSAQKIVDLINSAQTSIIMTVENFRYPAIQSALLAAVARGVDVRLIVPAADMNPDPSFNLQAVLAMQNVDVGGKTVSVTSRLMPAPPTAQTPYMHAKMIVVDAQTIYIGSENFSTNSLQFARELGVVFADTARAAQIKADFEADWSVSKPPSPAPAPASSSAAARSNKKAAPRPKKAR